MTTRRQFLGIGARVAAGAVGLGAAGAIGYELPGSKSHSTPSPEAAPAKSLSAKDPFDAPGAYYLFYSRPDLQPPRANVVWAATAASGKRGASVGKLLVSPKGSAGAGPGQQGFMILDADGRLRWFMPSTKGPFDLQYQQYQGRPVLTWWEGTVTSGTGAGTGVVTDTSFKQIARLGKVDGLWPDLHELNLTSAGTALMTAYHPVPADLSSVGGPTKGYALGAVALEVDVATGKLVRRWDSLDHVPVSETYQKLTGGKTPEAAFDYFHMNSLSLAADGDLLISSRDTWTVYKVDRSTGAIKWRLNGKKSDFSMGPGSKFYWQHHVRAHGDNQLTLFDDGSTPAEEAQSRGLVLNIDEAKMRCTLEQAFLHPARLLTPNQGSMQLLSDGGALIGYGAEPYFSRFSGDGELLLDGHFPTNIASYRVLAADVRLTPTEAPAVVIGWSPPGGSMVYVSWNGSTEVQQWRVLAGKTKSELTVVATQEWSDFETAVTVSHDGPYYQVVALDNAGNEIGRSGVATA